MIILIIAVGIFIYYEFRNSVNAPNSHKNDTNEMLKERFVKGEIDEQTYLQMKEILKR